MTVESQYDLWDLESGLRVMSGSEIVSSGFSADGLRMAMTHREPARVDTYLYVSGRWTRQASKRIAGARELMVDVSPDGELLALVREDKPTLDLWSFSNLKHKGRLQTPRGASAPVFAPDGGSVGLLVGSRDGRWELHLGALGESTTEVVGRFQSRPQEILSWGFSSDGSTAEITKHEEGVTERLVLRRAPRRYPIHLVVFPDLATMANTFLRFQEHYDSPAFQGKVFARKTFLDWFASQNGPRPYHEFRGGFNVPSKALRSFYAGKFDPLSADERAFLKLLPSDIREPYYVIGVACTRLQALAHECAHGLFACEPDYAKSVRAIVARHRPAALLTQMKQDGGYNPEVLADELNAYALTTSSAGGRYQALIRELVAEFTARFGWSIQDPKTWPGIPERLHLHGFRGLPVSTTLADTCATAGYEDLQDPFALWDPFETNNG